MEGSWWSATAALSGFTPAAWDCSPPPPPPPPPPDGAAAAQTEAGQPLLPPPSSPSPDAAAGVETESGQQPTLLLSPASLSFDAAAAAVATAAAPPSPRPEANGEEVAAITVPEEWLETTDWLPDTDAVRAAYLDHLAARLANPTAWLS